MSRQLLPLDATAQAELVRRGEITPLELVDAAIAGIERINSALNAVIIPLFDKARAAAAGSLPDGPFRGVPTLLKDLIAHSSGDPFHMGTRFLRDLGFTAAGDTHVVAKLRAAGFVIVGKTNTPELGTLPTTEPESYGATHNPWNLERSPGGSSGGSAAAVAAGMVAAAHASDGGGSIRIPASECGLVGLKPSRGRISLGPDFGEVASGLVTEGALTRSLRDAAAILDVLAGPMPGDPYTAPPPARPFRDEVGPGARPEALRVGLLTDSPSGLVRIHPDCVAAAERAASLLESLGHRVERAHPEALEDPQAGTHFLIMYATNAARQLDVLGDRIGRPIGPQDIDSSNWALAEMGRTYSAAQLLLAIDWLHRWVRRVAAWWVKGFDLLLTPTLSSPPPPLGYLVPSPDDPLTAGSRANDLACFTSPFNLTGQPAISLPLSWNAEGLPIGVQLVAAYAREDLLLRVGAQLEAASPWADRWPPIHA